MAISEFYEFIVATAKETFGNEIFKRRQLMEAVAERMKKAGKWTSDDDQLSSSAGRKSKGMANIDWGITALRKEGRLTWHSRDQWSVAEVPTDIDQEFIEGAKSLYTHLRIERNPDLIRLKKGQALAGQASIPCEICRFDFSKCYGNLGHGYVECHHVVPLSTLEGRTVGTKTADLIMVCSNCHRMIHRHLKMHPDQNDLRRLKTALLMARG